MKHYRINISLMNRTIAFNLIRIGFYFHYVVLVKLLKKNICKINEYCSDDFVQALKQL